METSLIIYSNVISLLISEDFADVVQKTELHSKIPFSLDGTFIKRYFGEVSEQTNKHSLSIILYIDL